MIAVCDAWFCGSFNDFGFNVDLFVYFNVRTSTYWITASLFDSHCNIGVLLTVISCLARILLHQCMLALFYLLLFIAFIVLFLAGVVAAACIMQLLMHCCIFLVILCLCWGVFAICLRRYIGNSEHTAPRQTGV